MANLTEKAKRSPEQKKAWELYRKHITGRGYVWDVECGMPGDVINAILEAIEWARKTK